MALLDKMLNRDNRMTQIQDEIKSLQIRKESVIATLNNEIYTLMTEKKEVLYQAGEKAYEGWTISPDKNENLESYWMRAREIDKTIQEKEAKKVEMETRYDEEISLLRGNMSVSNSTNGNCVCPKCNAAVGDSFMFCEKCGNKLR